jgi:predicted dehydrogenase
MATKPVRVACIGMGWWSDVLADAIKRSKQIEIVACFTRSEDKRVAFAKKYGCKPVATYEEVLADPAIEAIINTTSNDVHLPTTKAAAAAGKHVFLDKPIANNVTEGRAITDVCRKAGVILAMGYQRRRESHFRWVKPGRTGSQDRKSPESGPLHPGHLPSSLAPARVSSVRVASGSC